VVVADVVVVVVAVVVVPVDPPLVVPLPPPPQPATVSMITGKTSSKGERIPRA
jgi:hypothetical protein